jgi:integration host factor subunit alpha
MVNINFTRKDLSNKIFKNLGFSKSISSKIVDDIFDTLSLQLCTGKTIKISSFGTFKVSDKKERIGRNPKTKEQTVISARRVIKFKPSDLLKRKINK